MAESNHKLRTQRMELTISHPIQANEIFSLVSEICQNKLPEAIAKCLDEFSHSKDTVYAFDKIELDIEPLTPEELVNHLPERVTEQLRKVLTEMFVNFYETVEIKVSQSSDVSFETLSYFLRNGFLPWNAKQHNLNALLKECISLRPRETSGVIRKDGRNSRVRVRITERFPGSQLKAIVRLIEPSHSPVIVEYHQHLVVLNQKEAIVAVPQNTLEKTLWLFILNHLLVEQQTVFNRKAFSISLLRQFSCHFNIEFVDLLHLIQVGLRQWKRELPEPFIGLMEETISDFIPTLLNEKLTIIKPVLNGVPTRNQEEPKARLTDESAWRTIFYELLEKEPSEVAALLREFPDRQNKIHKIVTENNADLSKKIIRAIEPLDSSTIVKYHHNLVTIHSVDPVASATRHDIESILWAFIIIHCIENQQSQFNHKSFLKSLIFSFSSHYNLDKTDLLEKMIRSGASLQMQSASLRKCFSIMNEIFQEVSGQSHNFHQLKHSGNEHHRSVKNRKLSFVEGLNSWTSLSEKEFIKALREDKNRFASLLKTSSDSSSREYLTNLSTSSFNEIIHSILPASATAIIDQFMILAKKLENEIAESFATNRRYKKCVRQAVIEVADAIEGNYNISDREIFKRLVQSLAAQSASFHYSELMAFGSAYRNDPKLNQISRFMSDENQITSVLPSDGSVVDRLIKKIITAHPDHSSILFQGFKSVHEALTFIHTQYPEDLSRIVTKLSPKKREQFINRLREPDLDLLVPFPKTGSRYVHYIELMREWGSLLLGHNNRKEIGVALKRALLINYVFQQSPSFDELAVQLLDLFQKYKVGDAFFEKMNEWTLPRFGDATKAIQKIEKQVIQGIAKSSALKKKTERLKSLKEALQKANEKDVNMENAPLEKDSADGIYIANAGLVLIHPYLSFLFEQTQLMENGHFKTPAAAMRGIAMLHYTATGQQAFKEEDHVLNKLLCGVSVGENSVGMKLTEEEIKMIDGMLTALAEHWAVIKNSSQDDVRGNWLLREGRLRETDNYWELTVKRQAQDILMSSLPFTLSPVKYSWMKKMIMIHWL